VLFCIDDLTTLNTSIPPPLFFDRYIYIYIYNITFTICNDVLLIDNNLDLCFRYVVIGEKHVKTSYFSLFSSYFSSLLHLPSVIFFTLLLYSFCSARFHLELFGLFFTWLITKKTEADNTWKTTFSFLIH